MEESSEWDDEDEERLLLQMGEVERVALSIPKRQRRAAQAWQDIVPLERRRALEDVDEGNQQRRLDTPEDDLETRRVVHQMEVEEWLSQTDPKRQIRPLNETAEQELEIWMSQYELMNQLMNMRLSESRVWRMVRWENEMEYERLRYIAEQADRWREERADWRELELNTRDRLEQLKREYQPPQYLSALYPQKSVWVKELIREFGTAAVEGNLDQIFDPTFLSTPSNIMIAQRWCRGRPENNGYRALIIEACIVAKRNIGQGFFLELSRYRRFLRDLGISATDDNLPIAEIEMTGMQIIDYLPRGKLDRILPSLRGRIYLFEFPDWKPFLYPIVLSQ